MSETKTQGPITRVGTPVAGDFHAASQNVSKDSNDNNNASTAQGAGGESNTQQQGGQNDAGANGQAAQGQNAGATNGQAPAATEPDLSKLTDDQLKTLLEGKGITGFNDLEDLKTKFQKGATPAPVEPTAEEKAAQEKALDKRMLDFYVANGGSPEQYVALKQVVATNLKDLSVAAIHQELKEAGFSEDEIKQVLVERYYQLNPEEAKQGAEETDEDFKKRKDLIAKKATYGSKKLESRSAHIKHNAEQALADLRQAISTEDALKAQEVTFSSKVEEYSKTLPRTMTFELGQIDNKPIDPVPFKVTEEDITEVVNTLKDPAKRKQFFFNEDNSLNLVNVGSLMLRNRILESALKAVYIESGNRQVSEFEKVFPNSAHALGTGGNKQQGQGTGKVGEITRAGTPQVGNPQQ